MKLVRLSGLYSDGVPRDVQAGGRFIAGAFMAAVVAVSGQTVEAQSQKGKLGFVSENYEFSSVDGNGVDIQSGSVRIAADLLSIGAGDRTLSYSVITPSLAQTGASDALQLISYGLPLTAGGSLPFKFDNYSGGIGLSGINNCENWFEIGGSRSDFCGTLAQGLIAADGSNASLVQSGSELIYTDKHGVKYHSALNSYAVRQTATTAGIKKIVYPDGYTIDIHRGSSKVSIVDNRGFQIRITNVGSETATIVGFNMAVDYCAPLAASCSFTRSWPTATVYVPAATNPSAPTVPAVATDMAGLHTKLYPRLRLHGFSGYQYYQVKPATAAESARITYTFCSPWYDRDCTRAKNCGPNNPHGPELCAEFLMANNKVRTAEKNGKTWTYTFEYWRD